MESAPQEMEEIVGARLVGTDVSLDINMNGAESVTRYANGGKGWEKGDIVGLGWLVAGEPRDAQKESADPASYLYANHMYEYADGDWTTKGNMYEGWYYGYYPWSYEAQAGKMKAYVLNPDVKAKGSAYHMSQTLYLTNRQFIDAENDLDVQTNTLKSKFEMYQAVKFIQINTNAEKESAFADAEKMGNLPVKTVSITVGDESNKIFASSFKISAKHLPVKVEYPEGATVEEKAVIDMQNLSNFRNAYPKIAYDPQNSNTVERNVEGAGNTVSTENGKIYFNVVPGVYTFEAKDVTIEVNTGTASFIINGAKADLSEKNKKAIDDLVAAYAKDGCLSTINELDEEGNPVKSLSVLKLDIDLCDEDFTTDFTKISTIDEWKDAVAMVTTLKRTAAEFNIVEDITFEGEVPMPENCDLTVTAADGKKIILSGAYENGVPEKLNIEAVNVEIAKGAVIDKAHTINALSINNNGTLNVPAYEGAQADYTNPEFNTLAKVTNSAEGVINLNGYYAKAATVDNANGRINTVYGAFVELKAGTEAGVIAYQVQDGDVKNPTRIQNVINETNTTGIAGVNMLVFDAKNLEKDEFDFTKKTLGTEDDNDPYNPETGTGDSYTALLGSLNKVSLEIDGVNVKSSKVDVEVNNVIIKNAIFGAGITINGNLTVKEGNVTVTVKKIAGNLVVENGQGVITSETSIGNVEIKAGNITVNAEAINGSVNATGENYFFVKTIDGSATLTTKGHIEGAAIKGAVELAGEMLLVNVTAGSDVTVKSGTTKMDTVNIYGTLNVNKGATAVIAGKDAQVGSIENNGTLTTFVNVYTTTVAVYKGSTATVAEDKTIWYTKPNAGSYGYIQQGTTNGRILYAEGDNARNLVNVSTLAELQAALDNAGEGTTTITLTAKIEGSATVPQKENVKIIIDGVHNQFEGDILVDGKSARYETAALTIKNIEFVGTSAKDAFINLGDGTNATRYTNNVTVEGCSFDGVEEVAVKSYTGGDWNLKVNGCEVSKNCHSLLQIANVEKGLEITNCNVCSSRGVNLNATPTMTMANCTFAVKKYAVRFGQGSVVGGDGKIFNIKNSSLNSTCEEDAVIVFRGDASKATLNLENTTITGTPQYLGQENATINVK